MIYIIIFALIILNMIALYNLIKAKQNCENIHNIIEGMKHNG